MNDSTRQAIEAVRSILAEGHAPKDVAFELAVRRGLDLGVVGADDPRLAEAKEWAVALVAAALEVEAA